MNRSIRTVALMLGLLAAPWVASPIADAPLPAPPQDRGLPYTRSAQQAALAKIGGSVALFAGSRYAWVHGYKVRLDDRDPLHSPEALLRDGKVWAPVQFAALVSARAVKPDPAPPYLEDRWVYTLPRPAADLHGVPTISVDGARWFSPVDLARALGLQVYQNPRGLVLIGDKQIDFSVPETALLDDVITMFDTPEKFADPAIARHYIPRLQQAGFWEDNAKPTPEQLKMLEGPETVYPETPRSRFDLTGFNAKLLGSKVPPPGVYPRLLFSGEDLPFFAEYVKRNKLGQRSMAEIDVLLHKSFLDPNTSDGQVFHKLVTGDTASLTGGKPGFYGVYPGQKTGIYSSHVNYNSNALVTMALYCLLTGDDTLGRQVATAIYHYYQAGEPALDDYLKTSDSEFGTSADAANGAGTQWRGMHGLVGHMDLAFALDFGGKWMTPEQKDLMRRVIAKATYGRRSYGQDGPRRQRNVNWVTWDLPHFLAIASIEGLEGFDAEAYASGAETVQDFLEWGVDDHGQMFEGNGKNGGGMQFLILSMNVLARRGNNLWGHPHWRKMLEAQVYATAPNGHATVTSGTWGGGPLEFQSLNEIKAFYPESQFADYLLTNHEPGLDLARFDAEAYRAQIAKNGNRLRLPGITYPAMVYGVLYNTDWKPTHRADLQMPNQWTDPVHGEMSAASSNREDATWMFLHVRPNHYEGAGHHHADAGMFYMAGEGVNWFTESPFVKSYPGRLHNEVLVDGKAEERYNARGKYLGAALTPDAGFATADLTYAYQYSWNTQTESWSGTSDPARPGKWELEPGPEIVAMFRGTQRYKARIWWATYDFTNWLPTLRQPNLPMEYVFRSAGMVRGTHPYALVVDDLKMDLSPHLYQWTGMLGPGVWQAQVDHLASNQIVLAAGPPATKILAGKLPITPKAGDPLLLVTVLTPGVTVQVETVEEPVDGLYDRLTASVRAVTANFRVVMVPYRYGDPIPAVSDEFRFQPGADGRTRFTIGRAGKVLANVR